MKLKSARFTDVLSHVDSRFDFAERLTVFTGVSESGKSAIVRGLNQHFRNLPAGIDLLRHGAKRGACSEVDVLIEGDDGKEHSIVRRRGKSKNEYEIDGQPLNAIGREVPEEVATLLRLSPHAIQLQGARPPASTGNFLLCETDGRVAEVLSKAVGLVQIDAALAEVRTRKNANDEKLRLAQAEIEREEAAGAKYAGLDAATEAVIDAEYAESAAVDAQELVGMLVSIRDRLVEVLPDHREAVDFASCAVVVASRAAKASEASVAERADLSRIADELARLPAKADTLRAKDTMVDLDMAVVLRDGEQAVLGRMAATLAGLTALPRDAGIAPRRAALMLTQAQAAREKREMSESEIFEMENLHLALLRVSHDESVGIREADWRCLSAKNETCDLEFCAQELAGMEALVLSIGKTEVDRIFLGSAVAALSEEIEEYKRLHPVCPECGAEQKHWHANKGE